MPGVTSRRVPATPLAALLAGLLAGLGATPAAAASPAPDLDLPQVVLDDLTRAEEHAVAESVVDDEGRLGADGAGGADGAEDTAEVAVAVPEADGGLRIETLTVAEADAGDVVALLAAQRSVEAASTTSKVSAFDVTAPDVRAAVAAADPYRSYQWPLTRLCAEEVRAASPTSPLVAVVDTGASGTHPDLDGVLVPGIDLVQGGNGMVDPNGHGTHVAGVIGAEVGNGVGTEGLLAGARVMPVRVLDRSGSGSTDDVARGIVWAVDHGASVVNMSLGGTSPDSVLKSAVDYAEKHDVVVVAAMGNEGEEGSPTSYPAAYPSVLSVAATTSRDTRAAYSSVGAHARLAAPGDAVMSTIPGGWGRMSGTSMATPYVSASAAAVRGASPSLSAPGVRDLLTSTADDLGAVGRDPQFGYGLVDPLAALRRLTATRAAQADG